MSEAKLVAEIFHWAADAATILSGILAAQQALKDHNNDNHKGASHAYAGHQHEAQKPKHHLSALRLAVA